MKTFNLTLLIAFSVFTCSTQLVGNTILTAISLNNYGWIRDIIVKGAFRIPYNTDRRGMQHATSKRRASGFGVIPIDNIDFSSGRTPLQFASRINKIRIAELLLQNGANPNIKNRRTGWTSLHEANKTPMAKLLLDHGADPTITNSKGQSALQHLQKHPTINFDQLRDHPSIKEALKLEKQYAPQPEKNPQVEEPKIPSPKPPTEPIATSSSEKSVTFSKTPTTLASYSTIQAPLLLNTASTSIPPTNRLQKSSPTSFILNFKNIKVGEKIGSGGFGDVFKARWLGQIVAIKQLRLTSLSKNSDREFQQETKIWSRLRHPNITQLFGICVPPDPYCMIMHHKSEGSLFHLIKNRSKLPWSSRRQLAIDICSALLYLHKQNILHRDLKSLNVLISKENNRLRASLTDFGLSIVKSETITSSNSNTKVLGTLPWLAPELLDGKKCTKKSDIYAFGMVLWELAAQKIPFADVHQAAIASMILNRKLPAIPAGTPSNFATLITQCWNSDDKSRPSAQLLLTNLQAKPNLKLLHSTQSTLNTIASIRKLHTGPIPRSSTTSKVPVSLRKKRKALLNNVIKLFEEEYPYEDALDDPAIAKYRDETLPFFQDLQAKPRLTLNDELLLNNIKNQLLDE